MDTSQSLRLYKVSLAFKLKRGGRGGDGREGEEEEEEGQPPALGRDGVGLLASQSAIGQGWSYKKPYSDALWPIVLTAQVLHSGPSDPLTSLFSENLENRGFPKTPVSRLICYLRNLSLDTLGTPSIIMSPRLNHGGWGLSEAVQCLSCGWHWEVSMGTP